MKTYYKSEVADMAGVSMRTFQRWMASRRDILVQMGFNVHSKYIHPRALQYLAREYCIDISP